jgi:hypothetical protein
MTNLTVAYIKKAIAGDKRFDANLELDEAGKVIVWLQDGFTWSAADGFRTVEAFIISANNSDEAPRDTVAYWKQCVANIEEMEA